jgi:hypothetical protein
MENRNVHLDHWFSGGDLTRIQANAAELVSSAPDLIVASSTPVLMALKQATRTIPIVFCVVNQSDRASSPAWRGRADHRLHIHRLPPDREMAGDAQGDSSGHQADPYRQPNNRCWH